MVAVPVAFTPVTGGTSLPGSKVARNQTVSAVCAATEAAHSKVKTATPAMVRAVKDFRILTPLRFYWLLFQSLEHHSRQRVVVQTYASSSLLSNGFSLPGFRWGRKYTQAGWDFMVIAIDGPAGSGKSTVARRVAARLGFQYVDTGAMYRAVAHAALQQRIPLQDALRLEQLAASLDLRFISRPEGDRLLAGGKDVTEAIRAPEVAQAASVVSAIPGVRRALVALQQRLGREGQIVMEGRDIGTVVFPDARLKVYLDASPETRGRRRWLEKGGDLAQVIEDISQRDARDRQREHSPLRQAPDAHYLDTTSLTEDEVVERIVTQFSRSPTDPVG